MRLWAGDAAKVIDPSDAFAAPGVTFQRADVLSTQEPCRDGSPNGSRGCGRVAIEVTTGSAEGKRVEIPVPPEVSTSGLRNRAT